MSTTLGYGSVISSAVYFGIMEGIMELDIRLQMMKETYRGGYWAIGELDRPVRGTGLLAERCRVCN